MTVKTASIIDLAVHNMDNLSYANTIQHHFSDHFPVAICRKVFGDMEINLKFSERSYRNLEVDEFCSDLDATNWSTFDNCFNLNIAWRIMFNTIIEILDRHCSIKQFNPLKASPDQTTVQER